MTRRTRKNLFVTIFPGCWTEFHDDSLGFPYSDKSPINPGIPALWPPGDILTTSAINIWQLTDLGAECGELGVVLLVEVVECSHVLAVAHEPVDCWEVFTLSEFLVQTPEHLDDAERRRRHRVREVTTRWRHPTQPTPQFILLSVTRRLSKVETNRDLQRVFHKVFSCKDFTHMRKVMQLSWAVFYVPANTV